METGDAAEPDASEDAGGLESGEDVDAEVDDGAVPVETDATTVVSGTPALAVGAPCVIDEDCDDHLFCNGNERCAANAEGKLACVEGAPTKCTSEHPCLEEIDACDCTQPDMDGDKFVASACDGPDCDDAHKRCNPDGVEECDLADLDEDCNPMTVSTHDIDRTSRDGDRDGDGHIDIQCRNFITELRIWHRGDDCDDRNDKIAPLLPEVCNYIDDNCNNKIDEENLGAPEFSLRNKFYPDLDRDGYADMSAKPEIECVQRKPDGYIFETAPDCNDDPRSAGGQIHPNASESCDGIDNDCDGTKDENATILLDFEDTSIACQSGKVVITDCPDDKLWCDTPVERGCATDATTLTNCRACGKKCEFACGKNGCDEIWKIAAGSRHACAVTQEKRAACWGYGALGRLGNDPSKSSAAPVPVVAIRSVDAIAVGEAHSCAVVGADQKLVCWGSNAAGQLGADDIAPGGASEVPVSVSSGITWLETGTVGTDLIDVVDVDLAAEHSCAVLGTGHLACWGLQANGRLGNGDDTPGVFSSPSIGIDESRMPITNAEQVSIGRLHGCIATKAKSVACWGDNSNGQLGQSPQTLAHSSLIVAVPDLSNVTDVAAGSDHTCALAGGQVYCWGSNEHLQLGTRTGNPANYIPTAIAGLSNVVALAARAAHTCAIDSAGSAWCWGANGRGELRRDDFADSASPVLVAERATAIAPGDGFTCALTATGAACWGDNLFGQLGRGHTDFDPQPQPEKVSSLVAH